MKRCGLDNNGTPMQVETMLVSYKDLDVFVRLAYRMVDMHIPVDRS
jgi:hypothetical protein